MRQSPTAQERLEKARRLTALQKIGLDDLLNDVELALQDKWMVSKTPADDAKLCAERDGLKALRSRINSELAAASKVQLDVAAEAKASSARKKKGS